MIWAWIEIVLMTLLQSGFLIYYMYVQKKEMKWDRIDATNAWSVALYAAFFILVLFIGLYIFS